MLANGSALRCPLASPCAETRIKSTLAGLGEVAEWLKAAVLKTAERDERFVGSNPTLSSRKPG